MVTGPIPDRRRQKRRGLCPALLLRPDLSGQACRSSKCFGPFMNFSIHQLKAM